MSGEAQAWAVALPKLLWRATPDKVFVITSRSGIYRRALEGRPEPIWDRIACVLDADSYPDETRWAILLGKVRQEGGWRADLVAAHRGTLLRRLKSPLALDRFAQLLGRCPSPAEWLDLVQGVMWHAGGADRDPAGGPTAGAIPGTVRCTPSECQTGGSDYVVYFVGHVRAPRVAFAIVLTRDRDVQLFRWNAESNAWRGDSE